MKLEMYSVFDEKAAVFCQPFCAQNDQVAIRSFTNTVLDESSAIGMNAADYTLFHIGSFDDGTAKLIDGTARSLGNGLEIRGRFAAGADPGQFDFVDEAQEA